MITQGLGGPRGDVAEVVYDAGVVVEEDVRHEAAAVRDVEMSVLSPVARVDGALVHHLVAVYPALVAQTEGGSDAEPERGAAGLG